MGRVGEWARKLKHEVTALWLAAGDPRVPWYAKALAGLVLAYALSPVDLIPDFIPVIGLLDDILLIPLGIALVVKLMPPGVLDEHRARATEGGVRPPRSKVGAVLVALVWLLVAAAVGAWLLR